MASVVAASAAGAGERSVVWNSKVTYGTALRAMDGDTEEVRVTGDPSWLTPPQVRNTGIQTMEIGQCHAGQASAAMSALTKGKQVRMTAVNPATSSLGRPVRLVDVRTATGSWSDPQLAMLKAGHALPLNSPDSTRWKPYMTAAQQAAKARVNLFDTDFCGSGPSQATPLKVWVMWDGNGDESKNPNLEYVRVLNSSKTNLSLRGWWMRTGGQDSYRFPSNAVVPAGGYLTLLVGKGTNSPTRVFWGSPTTKFSNADVAANRYGSGAFLFDPQGDVRAWSMYPCLYACTDPLAGKVKIAVRADAAGDDAKNVNGEYLHITPAGRYTIDLSYKAVAVNGHTFEFPKGSYVRYGEKLVLHMGKGSRTRLNQFWGNTQPSLANAGGKVEVRTHESIRLGCRAWGTGRC